MLGRGLGSDEDWGLVREGSRGWGLKAGKGLGEVGDDIYVQLQRVISWTLHLVFEW